MRCCGAADASFPSEDVFTGCCCWPEQLPATTATTKANVNLIRRLRQTSDMALVYVESGCRALKTPLRLRQMRRSVQIIRQLASSRFIVEVDFCRRCRRP